MSRSRSTAGESTRDRGHRIRTNRHKRPSYAGLLCEGHWRAAPPDDYARRGEEVRGTYGVAAEDVADPVSSDGLSGGTSRYWSANRAICWKTGAATVPPKIAPCGSSTVTRMTRRGAVAGTMPTNEATYFDVE